MTVSREAIEHAIGKWERRAKSEMYLDDFLHPKARAWLIEELMLTMFVSGDQWSDQVVAKLKAQHVQSAPESSEVESSRVESGFVALGKHIESKRKKGT